MIDNLNFFSSKRTYLQGQTSNGTGRANLQKWLLDGQNDRPIRFWSRSSLSWKKNDLKRGL